MVKYLFVGGAQRTGTTMLQTLLCQHNETNEMLGEASYLRGLIQAYQLGKMAYTHETEDYFESEEAYRCFHSSIIEQFLALQFEQRPATKCMVLKEPHLTKHFPFLFELLPQAKFLIIMRDPRDAIGSMIRVGEKMKQRGEKHFFQQRNMEQLSEYYLSFYLPVFTEQNEQFRQQVCVIRYEDLVSGKPSVNDAIYQFSGLQLEQNTKSNDLELGKFDALKKADRYQPWSTSKLGKTPNTSSVGRYKSVLTSSEIQRIEKGCAQIMSQYLYV